LTPIFYHNIPYKVNSSQENESLSAWPHAERTAAFDIPFDRQQLADFLCVERSALSAEISRLSKLGLITSRKNNFTMCRK